jgi:hypothetical protein
VIYNLNYTLAYQHIKRGLTGQKMKAGRGWYYEGKRDPPLVKTAAAELETGTPALKHSTCRKVASPSGLRIFPYLRSYSPKVSIINWNIYDPCTLHIFHPVYIEYPHIKDF